jgi:hypothetical protein
MAKANAFALFALAPVCLVLCAAYGLLHGWSALVASAGAFFAPFWRFMALVLGGVVAHEGLHGIAWRWASGLPASAISFGVQWKTLTPYAHASAPMRARAYRIGAAAPGVVLGLVPALVGLAMGWGLAFAFGVFFTFAAGGDALILWLLRGVPSDTHVSDHPTHAGCLVHLPPPAVPTG